MRLNIPDVIFLIFLIILCFFSVFGLLSTKNNHLISVQYDCRLSEISPDYPQVVKQKCRELMK